MLNKLFAQYTGFFRNLKVAYVINNLLNADKLVQNRELYRKYKLYKSIFSPLGSKDFKYSDKHDQPWLDQPDAIFRIVKNRDFSIFEEKIQESIKQFIREGYMVLDDFFDEKSVDALNAEVDELLKTGKAGFNYTGRKIMGLTEVSELANNHFFRNAKMLQMLSYLLGKDVIPFHSINFIQGSEQRAHSDSIHMSTEPKGYLIAIWIALEDCTEENGPLFFYPRSHKLPYVTTQDYKSGNTFFSIGSDSNTRYEDKIAAILAENNFEKRHFIAKKGSVLIWHANLIHGGSPIIKEGATRKSMVCHYFGEDVICYHEMSQRPALMPRKS